MAKRQVFEISINGEVFDTRSTWNASRRSVEAKVRAIGRTCGVLFERQAMQDVQKDGCGMHVKGTEKWLSKTGEALIFSITKACHS